MARSGADILPANDAERAQVVETPAGEEQMADRERRTGRRRDRRPRLRRSPPRDPDHQRTWVALVDGNNHQIDRISHEAPAPGVPVTILCDLVHVLEYLWRAAWCFRQEGDPAAEQ